MNDPRNNHEMGLRDALSALLCKKKTLDSVSCSYRQLRGHRDLLVDLGPVGDVLGPVRVVEGGEGLLEVDSGRGDGGDDGGLGAATE